MPQIVSPAERDAARAALLVKEKAAREDTPPGRPQGPARTWWRRHDEYEAAAR
jgi:predicted dithiol-disulfide oxidoreductase (DUF899 family)